MFRKYETLRDVESLREFCVAYEAVIAALRKDGKPWYTRPGNPGTPPTNDPPCEWCGSKHQQGRRYCEARNKACRYCGITGHLEKVCKTKL